MNIQRSGQLVCEFSKKGTYLCFWLFDFYLYLQGLGDSSGNAIPEEWAANLQIQGNLYRFFFFVFVFYLYLQGVGDSSGNAIPEEWAANLQFKGTYSST